MQILIGGSPSTGSSLLRQMLNRHPEIYCGPETGLFLFPELVERWSVSKRKLTGRRLPMAARLKSMAIRQVSRASLVGEEQGWDLSGVRHLIETSPDFRTFTEKYFGHPCSKYGKRYWAEKTPENVLAFGLFREIWDNGQVIHITRHPADTITSLRARGLSLFTAVARYLYHTAFGLKHRDSNGYHEVQYSTLVSEPERTLSSLMLSLGLPFDRIMLKGGNPDMTEADSMKGWTYSELDAPGRLSVDRFSTEEPDIQHQIVSAMYLIRIPDVFATRHGLQHRDIPAIASALGADLPAPDPAMLPGVRRLLEKEMRRYRWQRMRHFDWFFEKETPLVIARTV